MNSLNCAWVKDDEDVFMCYVCFQLCSCQWVTTKQTMSFAHFVPHPPHQMEHGNLLERGVSHQGKEVSFCSGDLSQSFWGHHIKMLGMNQGISEI
jgi:hypothetical protein